MAKKIVNNKEITTNNDQEKLIAQENPNKMDEWKSDHIKINGRSILTKDYNKNPEYYNNLPITKELLDALNSN